MKGWRQAFPAAIGMALLFATPAAAQFSDSYKFLKGVRDRDGAEVTEMLGKGASTLINTRDFNTSESALHIVTKGRDTTWLRFLLAKGASPETRDNEGNTPLMTAAQLGWSEGVDYLIKGGANVNAANRRGETPLIFATFAGDIASVRMLMKAGANAERADLTGMSARAYAERDRRLGPILKVMDETKADEGAKPKVVSGPGL
jgi:hypothetical protein